MRDLNLIICGVGGQGIIFLTRMIGETMIKLDKDVVSSEAHGLSRMLGSVSSMMRIGKHESGSFKEADVVIAMEPLEALRHNHLLSDDGLLITSSGEVRIKGYPEDIREKLESLNSVVVDTKKLCKEIDDRSRDNVVLCGVFCKKFGIPADTAEQVIKTFKDADKNIAAFKAGFGYET